MLPRSTQLLCRLWWQLAYNTCGYSEILCHCSHHTSVWNQALVKCNQKCLCSCHICVKLLTQYYRHLPKSNSVFPLKCCFKNKDNKQDTLREEIWWDSTNMPNDLNKCNDSFFCAQINVLAVMLSECKVRQSYTNCYTQRWLHLTEAYCYHFQEFFEVISGRK